MALRKTKVPAKQYESIAGQEGRIKTDIYSTDPRTVITVKGQLDDAVSLELRFIVDTFLKDKGL